jgi:hypothetical protein
MASNTSQDWSLPPICPAPIDSAATFPHAPQFSGFPPPCFTQRAVLSRPAENPYSPGIWMVDQARRGWAELRSSLQPTLQRQGSISRGKGVSSASTPRGCVKELSHLSDADIIASVQS